MRSYQHLSVWRRACSASLKAHRLSASYPTTERYGLISQLRRAAHSVTSNIVEGAMRESIADYARFLDYALASAAEARQHVQFGQSLGYGTRAEAEEVASEYAQIGLMLAALARRLRG